VLAYLLYRPAMNAFFARLDRNKEAAPDVVSVPIDWSVAIWFCTRLANNRRFHTVTDLEKNWDSK
jgi:hypothetical protein